MQIEFFDIIKADEQEIVLPWPLNILKAIPNGDRVRLYYTLGPGATEQRATFYFIKTEQLLPDAFPGHYAMTIDPPPAAMSDDTDDALHLFIKTPVNRPRKPFAAPAQGGDDNGAA